MSRTFTADPWVAKPLETFVEEAGARLALLMTPEGQVIAQYGFTRSVDVMAAAALGAGIVSSTAEIAKLLDEPAFSVHNHQGERHGILLAGLETPNGALICLAVYGPESTPGLVQLFFEEFSRDVCEFFPKSDSSTKSDCSKRVLAADFERELNESLTALFQV